MIIIDPMHNLFLGTAKHIAKNVWMKKDFLTESSNPIMQKVIDDMKVPPDVGRIAGKIASGFDHFTADQ